jgi:lipopolysaccharide export system permease protein
MRILDRERYWAFLKAYIICFIALVGLYVVIDAFENVDEFGKRADGTLELFKVMGRYYLVHMSLYYDQLCGVIGMMAAIFTVTWVQRNNELLAMLAAGISTHRVIRPVWVSTLIVSLLAVVNQEFIIPPLADELQRRHDDDGTQRIQQPPSRYDSDGILFHANSADRASKTLLSCSITIPSNIYGVLLSFDAQQARYIPVTDRRSPLNDGWLLRGTHIKDINEIPLAEGPLVPLKNATGFPRPFGDSAKLEGKTFFLKSALSFEATARSRDWHEYAPTPALIASLSDPSTGSHEQTTISVFLHNRLLRPLLSLNLMMLSLPLVLGGQNKNMFINLGLSLGTSAVFYGLGFLSRFLGQHHLISAELSAWAPLIGFGSIAVGRWGRIRT